MQVPADVDVQLPMYGSPAHPVAAAPLSVPESVALEVPESAGAPASEVVPPPSVCVLAPLSGLDASFAASSLLQPIKPLSTSAQVESERREPITPNYAIRSTRVKGTPLGRLRSSLQARPRHMTDRARARWIRCPRSSILARMAVRTATVDWKDHPLEVMSHLDALAGAKWRRDPERWAGTDALDLDTLRAQPFLEAVQPLLAAAGFELFHVEADSDDVTFGVVPIGKLTAAAAAWKKAKGTKLEPVRAAKTRRAKAPKPVAAQDKLAEAKRAVADLEAEIASAAERAGVVWAFKGLYVARLVMAAGAPEAEIYARLHAIVDLEVGLYEINRFTLHGPQVDGEALGAALLVGRGGELVRAMAHVHSLGQRGKTALYEVFLGRDLPANWKRGDTGPLDRLLLAPKASLARAIEEYLTKVWSTASRGMKGSRASLLASGLLARAGVPHSAIKPELRVYLTTLPALPEPKKRAAVAVPAPPKLGTPPKSAARDASRPAETFFARAREWAIFVAESVAYAKKERSGMYLRALPETSVDIATLLYATGSPLDEVRRWLAYAVDLDIARCEGRFAEDNLAVGARLHVVAGAAVLVGKERALAEAWAARRGDARLPALRAWLTNKKPTAPEPPAQSPLAKAIVASVATGDGKKFCTTAGALPHESREPWPGPFDAFVTALAKRRAFEAPPVMRELLGLAPPAREVPAYGKPRMTLRDAKGIAASQERLVETSGEPLDRARACLVVARCEWALGAPPKAVGAWLHKAVDFAKGGKHLDEDLIGAARLIHRAPELIESLHVWPGAPDGGAPERAFAAVLGAYAKGSPPPPHENALAKRFYYAEIARAMRAARTRDREAFASALAKAPWQHRREWTSGDDRKRPPYWSFMITALAADMGDVDALPPTSRPLASADLVAWSLAGSL